MKLLHERLREIAESNNRIDSHKLGNLDIYLYPRQAEILLGEIEKYYAPKPLDENGEPWNIEDETTFGDIDDLILDETGWSAHVVNEDGCFFRDIDKLKRPEPKVLDADGVEILPGETVYFVDSCYEWEVQTVYEDCVDLSYCDQYATDIDPSRLTHKEPDSLEKLRDDMRQAGIDGETDYEVFHEFADRLTAIMEREN